MVLVSKSIRIVVFDLDGTLTNVQSTWQYLHEMLGTWNVGRQSAEDYWEGKIDYDTWAQVDSKMWQNVELATMKTMLSQITYMDGARETIARLRREKKVSGIVSAGISILAEKVRKDLGMDFAIANELNVSEGRMIGTTTVNVSLREKGLVIKRVVENLGFSLEECAVVGDNIYDLPEGAGLRIAFNPTDVKTVEACDVIVNGNDLTEILKYIIAAP